MIHTGVSTHSGSDRPAQPIAQTRNHSGLALARIVNAALDSKTTHHKTNLSSHEIEWTVYFEETS